MGSIPKNDYSVLVVVRIRLCQGGSTPVPSCESMRGLLSAHELLKPYLYGDEGTFWITPERVEDGGFAY